MNADAVAEFSIWLPVAITTRREPESEEVKLMNESKCNVDETL